MFCLVFSCANPTACKTGHVLGIRVSDFTLFMVETLIVSMYFDRQIYENR